MGLRSGLCAGQSSSYTQISTNHFSIDLALCMGALSCWNSEWPQNCCHIVRSIESYRMSYGVALRYPFTGTKGRSPNHKKQPQIIILYSWHSVVGQVAFSWHPPNPDLSIRLSDEEAWYITPEKAFPLLQSPMEESVTPVQLTLGIETLTALIFDRGNSSSAEIDSAHVERLCHIESHWALQYEPFYCQCLSMEIAWLCAWFDIPVSNGCGWNSRIH
jgi:hypothetical protein